MRGVADYREYDRQPRRGANTARRNGFGCTEAPRGICWHHYEFEADGTIRRARIVPPTSQNQPCIESDLAAVAGGMMDSPDDEIRHRCEQTIRNYDPCISCSTHFLKLSIRRS
jgi:coenzyme F420-reducing hydrogenase alpha subunit